jgi:hypothetical protein
LGFGLGWVAEKEVCFDKLSTGTSVGRKKAGIDTDEGLVKG